MAKSLLAFSFAEAQAGREHTFTGKYYVLGSSAVVTGLPRERATGMWRHHRALVFMNFSDQQALHMPALHPSCSGHLLSTGC